jgi:dihydroorotase
MQRLTLTAPDDWHIHLRDGKALLRTVDDASTQFARAIVMPNLVPPVRNAADALAYRDRIRAAVPQGRQFDPLMVLYLTDSTSPDDIRTAKAQGVVACKLYPAGATTNSDSGVTDITRCTDTLVAMADCGMLLLVHGEVTDAAIDIFDREAVFIERVLRPLLARIPHLKVVFEHITTQEAVEFVKSAGPNVAATLTAHHLLYNRNHMLVGGIRPHYYCLPVLKRASHQAALLEAATSGLPCFFLGTDSAPHSRDRKESACGCAGSYTAPLALALYAQAFESVGKLERLEAFASHFGPDFYGLPRNSHRLTLVKKPWTVPTSLPFEPDTIIPLCAGETLDWQLDYPPSELTA